MKYIDNIIRIFLLLLLHSYAKAQTDRFTLAHWKEQSGIQINLLPLYGNKPKSEKEQSADREFLEQIHLGELRSDIRHKSNQAAESGWNNYYSGALDTAMFRFNQSWLIDSTNTAPYVGFAVVYSTLGDTAMIEKMFVFTARHDTISQEDFSKIIKKNINYFRKLERQQYQAASEYKPVKYHATGQLFIERKSVGNKYHYKWYYENGNLLREVDGGEDPDDWKGEVTNYHDNGVIAFKGKWNNNFFKTSSWTSYDRDGKISQIEYWKKGLLSSSYNKTKTIIYSQEIPWKKGSYVIISKSGWTMKEGSSGLIFPDGYIQEVYNDKDPLYKYYAIWKGGKRGTDLMQSIPDDCEMTTAEGSFEWFQGKCYQIK